MGTSWRLEDGHRSRSTARRTQRRRTAIALEARLAEVEELARNFADRPEQIRLYLNELRETGAVDGAEMTRIFDHLRAFAGDPFVARVLRSRSDRSAIRAAGARVRDANAARAERTEGLVAELAPALGLPSSQVEIHIDDEARRRTDAVGARGTMEQGPVYLHPARYDPNTADGRRLLGHELTHVAQRSLSGRPAAGLGLAEAEARRVGDAFAGGARPSRPSAALSPLARAADTGEAVTGGERETGDESERTETPPAPSAKKTIYKGVGSIYKVEMTVNNNSARLRQPEKPSKNLERGPEDPIPEGLEAGGSGNKNLDVKNGEKVQFLRYHATSDTYCFIQVGSAEYCTKVGNLTASRVRVAAETEVAVTSSVLEGTKQQVDFLQVEGQSCYAKRWIYSGGWTESIVHYDMTYATTFGASNDDKEEAGRKDSQIRFNKDPSYQGLEIGTVKAITNAWARSSTGANLKDAENKNVPLTAGAKLVVVKSRCSNGYAQVVPFQPIPNIAGDECWTSRGNYSSAVTAELDPEAATVERAKTLITEALTLLGSTHSAADTWFSTDEGKNTGYAVSYTTRALARLNDKGEATEETLPSGTLVVTLPNSPPADAAMASMTRVMTFAGTEAWVDGRRLKTWKTGRRFSFVQADGKLYLELPKERDAAAAVRHEIAPAAAEKIQQKQAGMVDAMLAGHTFTDDQSHRSRGARDVEIPDWPRRRRSTALRVLSGGRFSRIYRDAPAPSRRASLRQRSRHTR